MNDHKLLKAQIRKAFSIVEYPGDWCLVGSTEGEEPVILKEEFMGKNDWEALPASFLDQAPDGFGSALSFFSDEAFRFYLPAYLIADIDGLLEKHSPVFHLTHSFTNEQKDKKLNPKRYGERTWFESARHKFSVFNKEQVSSIISYLKFKKERDAFGANEIGEALKNYWFERSAIADLVGCVNEM